MEEKTSMILPEWIETQLSQGREFRQMQPMEVREAQDGEEDQMVIEGYACTFNEFYTLFDWGDYVVQEQIDARAFDECDMSDFILQVDHHGKVYARNRNKTITAEPDEHGLHVRGTLAGVSGGGDLYSDIKGGYYDRMSFAFTVKEDKREVIEDHETGKVVVKRTITKIAKLYDVSVVSFPANDATEIFARGMADGAISWAAQEVRAFEARRKAQQRLRLKLKLMEV